MDEYVLLKILETKHRERIEYQYMFDNRGNSLDKLCEILKSILIEY